ncbi:hypothetical protein JWS14_48560 (plasmid) [Rhodococcus koreensis]|nr:hypothetical protein JWS14_48560 [Rhodococcus koreensis]
MVADPETAFEAWKKSSAGGRPCDYTGITYDRLRGGSGIQWSCNANHPDGTERLYTDDRFFSAPDYCESCGKDGVPRDQVTSRTVLSHPCSRVSNRW